MIGAIVLAAGSSRRFGGDKRKATLPDGKMILHRSVDNALACFGEVILVLRHGDIEFAAELSGLINNPNLNIFKAPDSALGMGHSLANAIQQVDGWDGVFVFLADMPFIKHETLLTLKDVLINRDFSNRPSGSVEMTESGDGTSHRHLDRSGEISSPIVVPTYEGQYGHPVGFSSNYFDELAALTSDKGAKPVINANPDNVVEIEVDDPGVLKDVDTPSDIGD